MADGCNRRGRAKLLAQASHAHVDDVRTRVEVIAPDVGEQPLPAQHLSRVHGEVMQEAELALGQIDGAFTEPRLAARNVELQSPDAQHKKKQAGQFPETS